MEAMLKIHKTDFSEDGLILNAKDFPDINANDIIKVCHSKNDTGDPSNYIIIKGACLKESGELPKDNISMAQNLASLFSFNVFQTVYVFKEKISNVTLDMIEVTFKDQYISRSDMWRLKKNLVGSIAYFDQKIEYSDIRAQVNDLWKHTNKVQCGLITDETKIVLRSASALVYIFIQMSAEMWDLDAYGQLNFENAINGFLKELFVKWKHKCCHEITMVLFSRTIYNTTDYADFPEHMRSVVQVDFKGRLYIDFYKTIVQNFRQEDCSSLLRPMKKIFNKYLDKILDVNLPKGVNSVSSEGNFLEAMNMALNVFEKHYMNRNFDRTGQLVMCVTPGVGVYHVDRSMTVLTKERMIDDGIGSDLVCLGQQPLHAVPLFIFHAKEKNEIHKHSLEHDFNIPHWINHSFYSNNPYLDKGTTGITHVPRIHLASRKKNASAPNDFPTLFTPEQNKVHQFPTIPQLDYEEYDKNTFSLPRNSSSSSLHHQKSRLRISEKRVTRRIRTNSDDWKNEKATSPKHSDPVKIPRNRNKQQMKLELLGGASSIGATINLDNNLVNKKRVQDQPAGLLVGSANTHKTMPKKTAGRLLINPFVALPPYSIAVPSNRQRWGHTFPRGPHGEMLIQHYQYTADSRSRKSSECFDDEVYTPTSSSVFNNLRDSSPAAKSDLASSIQRFRKSTSSACESDVSSYGSEQLSSSPTVVPSQCPTLTHLNICRHNSSSSFLNSLMHEVEAMWRLSGSHWTTDLLIGVDWKSLRYPACLPITNDSFPSKQKLQTDFVEQTYTLLADYVQTDRDSMELQATAKENFLELVNQRLCQGFQLVVGHNNERQHYNSSNSYSTVSSLSPGLHDSFSISPTYSNNISMNGAMMSYHKSYKLNHGRQYHIVQLVNENNIFVKIYRPKHPTHTQPQYYKYMLWPTTGSTYEPSSAKFDHEKLENYYWNYLDHYITLHNTDDDNFVMTTNMKYWRTKFTVIASPAAKLQKLKAMNEGKTDDDVRFDGFDIAAESGNCDKTGVMAMMKFVEQIYKIKRPQNYAMKNTQWRSSANLSTSNPAVSASTHLGSSLTSLSSANLSASTGKSRHMKNVETILQDAKSLPTSSPIKQQATTDKDTPETAQPEKNKLTTSAPVADILAELRSGVLFFPAKKGIPQQWFVSIDAVHWAIEHIEGIANTTEAVAFFENLRKDECICHGSGQRRHPFVYGYFIYYLVPNKLSAGSEDSIQQIHEYETNEFYKIWMQVEITDKDDQSKLIQALSHHKPISKLTSQLEKNLIKSSQNEEEFNYAAHNMIEIEMDNKNKTARSEWCRLLYQTKLHPSPTSLSFIFKLQWLVLTATCLSDKIQSWVREAWKCGLFLFPMPNDPFAFPHSDDVICPLQTPLFVPVLLPQIAQKFSHFKDVEHKETEFWKTVINFLEKIALNFGFIHFPFGLIMPKDKKSQKPKCFANSLYYVHFTGQSFLQIPINKSMHVHRYNESITSNLETKSRSGCCAGVSMNDIGFYWSRNYMLNKNWKSSDEDCPVDLLSKDFIKFCENHDDRLCIFFKKICENNDKNE